MTNYEAILKMNPEQMKIFLGDIYATGLNNGLYMATLAEEEGDAVMAEAPFGAIWLSQEAEPAVLFETTEEGDEYVPEALAKAMLRYAGIEEDELIAQFNDETEK